MESDQLSPRQPSKPALAYTSPSSVPPHSLAPVSLLPQKGMPSMDAVSALACLCPLAISPSLLEGWHPNIHLLSHRPLYQTPSLISHPTETLDPYYLRSQISRSTPSLVHFLVAYPPHSLSLHLARTPAMPM